METNLITVLILLFMPKKGKEILRIRFSGNKFAWMKTFVRLEKLIWWETTLNLQTLAYYEDLLTCPLSCQSFLHPKIVSSLYRQVDFVWHFFFRREHILGMLWLSFMLKLGKTDECQNLEHIKEIYKSIYWREVLSVMNLVPKLDPRMLTIAELAIHPHLIFKSWRLCVYTL